ncbi:hypothetical protein VFPPC_02514 [Pochonia chlamydosporia 170]|uniref:Bacteriophage T5 Orf172 DNA-binding domain-containing protein n=1 Tax=Pochonia chlamydosporia 170 TaxID=1380566 RepID=A0A179FXR0_METCM|nr:hypothetical protein VFPPC_02514 [Pochonia chlamydosporia 170]OAQ69970.1 hypothetical protein VFPPC_02514 [Pochonia chlamydosporia 170]
MDKNPLYKSLAVVLDEVDSIRIWSPYDGNCIAKTRDNKRCKHYSGRLDEREEVEKLQSKFDAITKIPNVDDKFCADVRHFVEYRHCSQAHREKAMKAFEEWSPSSMSASPPKTTASSEGSQEAEQDSNDETASSLIPDNDTVDTLPSSPKSVNVVTDHLKELTLTTLTKQAVIVSGGQVVGLGEETITTADNSVIDIDDGTTSQTEEVTQVSLDSDVSKITGLGSANLRRSGSMRDSSSIFEELYKRPTDKKMAKGIVYILESTNEPGHFKVGYTEKSTIKRLSQPKNCYGINTKIIHQTQGGHFSGAYQAERIAHVVLRHFNLIVSNCIFCQGAHKEWFRAPESVIRETVIGIENFVKMPAYTLQMDDTQKKEVWKLTDKAHDILTQMCSFSIHRLSVCIAVNAKSSHEKPVLDAYIGALSLEDASKEEYAHDDGPGHDAVPSANIRRSNRLARQTAVVVKQAKKFFRRSSGGVKGVSSSEAEVAPQPLGEFMDRFRELMQDFKNDFNEEMRRNSQEQMV